MAPAPKGLHISAVGLFGVALVFYVLEVFVPAIVLGLIGIAFEVAAWLTLFGGASSADDTSKGPDAT
jgi:membrane-bound ClpP family serine protease